MEKERKEIGLGYTLQIVTEFRDDETVGLCKEWSKRTIGQPDVVFRQPQWFLQNLVYAIVVYAPDESVVGTGGMIRSYEDKQPVFFETPMGEKLDVYELCSNVVLHEGMGIAKRMIAERLLIAEERNWASVIVTKNKAIKVNARSFNMIQVSKSKDSTIVTFGETIRICSCAHPDPSIPFFGPRCDTCPRNNDIEGGKRIFLHVPGSMQIELPMIHEKKEEEVIA